MSIPPTSVMHQLKPNDMGICGPGQTLHFTGGTYRTMIQGALEKGLSEEAAAAGEPPSRTDDQLPACRHRRHQACTSLADELYEKFTAPHKKHPSTARTSSRLLYRRLTFDEHWERRRGLCDAPEGPQGPEGGLHLRDHLPGPLHGRHLRDQHVHGGGARAG